MNRMFGRVRVGVAATGLVLTALGVLPATAGAAAPPAATATPVRVELSSIEQQSQIQSTGDSGFRHPQGAAALEQQRAEGQSKAPSSDITGQAATPSGPTPKAPTGGTGFDGISDAESFCFCYPPDGSVSAGPNHIVAAVNTSFKIWNKSGLNLVPATSLGALFAPNTVCKLNISDPTSYYDGGHFILEALTYDNAYTSTICIAVSTTADPTGSYWVYGFPVSPTGNLFDFPQVGVGSDAIYVSGNQFQNGATYTGARIYALNKSQMYTGVSASYVFKNVGNNAAGLIADTVYPAKGVSVAKTMYFLGADNNAATGNNISVWKWTDPFGANTFALRGGVTVTTYSQPPLATQPGGTTDAGDVRNLGAAYAANTLYGTHTIGCNPGGGTVPCVQWYQVSNIDGTPSLTQQGILGGSGQSRYYPNLAVDKSGNVLMAYAYASTTEHPGIRYTGRLSSDAVNTMQTEATMKAGEGFIDGTRYGDYAGTFLDPDGCTVWHLEEYAKTGFLWGTWIGSMKFASCGGTPPPPDFSLSATPSSRTVVAGSSTTYTVTVTPSNGFTGSVALSVSGLGSGASGSFAPNPVTGGSGTSTLTVTTTPSATTGTFPLTITGTSGSLSHTAGVTLVVNPAATPDFSVSATPSSRSVAQGGSTTYSVTVTPSGGFSSAVTLSVSGVPSGASGSFSPNPVPGGNGTSTLTVNTGTAAAGTYSLTITGTGGGLTRSASPVSLTITRPDFGIGVSPGSRTAPQGTSTTYTVSITPTGGFTGTVTLSVSGLPGGTTGTFSPATLTSGNSTLTVAVGAATVPGTYTITITGTSGSLSHSVTATLVVTAAARCVNGDGEC
jgi:hypothetical protein